MTGPLRILAIILGCITAVSCLYAQSFEEVLPGFFKPTALGYTCWGDINNDGFQDLFITGPHFVDEPSNPIQIPSFDHSIIYINNADGTFRESGVTNIPPGWWGSAAFGDFNNDGWLDLIGSVFDDWALPNTRLFINNRDETFTRYPGPLPNLAASKVLWLDYDNDGWQDVFMIGYEAESGGGTLIKLMRNVEGQEFVDSGVVFNGIARGFDPIVTYDALSADFDNDLDTDLVITHQSSEGFAVELYENNHATFARKTSQLPQYHSATLATADFNADGNLDLVVNGVPTLNPLDLPGLPAHFVVMLGDGNLSFREFRKFTNQGTYWGSVVTGDLNNDGLPDIVINGSGNGNIVSELYRNTGTDFVQEQSSLPALYLGETSFSDYDGDGDLDIFFLGTTGGLDLARAHLYRNNSSSQNLRPSVPSNQRLIVEQGSVRIAWDRSTDDSTSPKSISYNVWIGTEPNKGNILSGLTNQDGRRQVSALGNSGLVNTKALVPVTGDFYFHVQAIDAAYHESLVPPQKKGCLTAMPQLTYKDHYCFDEMAIVSSDSEIDVFADEAMTELLYSGTNYSFAARQEQVMFVIKHSPPDCAPLLTVVSFTVSDEPEIKVLLGDEQLNDGDSILLTRCNPMQTYRVSVETNFPFRRIMTTDLSGEEMEITGTTSIAAISWDDHGCEAWSAATIEVSELSQIVVPNVITPNADRKNDVLKFGVSEGLEVLIVNRYGERVYHSTEYANDFDGGSLSAGVYFMQVTVKQCGTVRKEFLQIIR